MTSSRAYIRRHLNWVIRRRSTNATALSETVHYTCCSPLRNHVISSRTHGGLRMIYYKSRSIVHVTQVNMRNGGFKGALRQRLCLCPHAAEWLGLKFPTFLGNYTFLHNVLLALIQANWLQSLSPSPSAMSLPLFKPFICNLMLSVTSNVKNAQNFMRNCTPTSPVFSPSSSMHLKRDFSDLVPTAAPTRSIRSSRSDEKFCQASGLSLFISSFITISSSANRAWGLVINCRGMICVGAGCVECCQRKCLHLYRLILSMVLIDHNVANLRYWK